MTWIKLQNGGYCYEVGFNREVWLDVYPEKDQWVPSITLGGRLLWSGPPDTLKGAKSACLDQMTQLLMEAHTALHRAEHEPSACNNPSGTDDVEAS